MSYGPRPIESRATLKVSRNLVLLAILTIAYPANANWRVSPSVGVGLLYDDNVFLVRLADASLSDSGMLLEGYLQAEYSAPRSEFQIRPRVRVSRYNDLDALDSEDSFLDFGYSFRGQKSRFRLRGNFADESVRTAERFDVDFDAGDTDEIPVDDSGILLGTDSRRRTSLNPDWTYQISQRTFVRLAAGYRDVTYDDRLFGDFNDYSSQSYEGALGFRLSQRNTLSVLGYYRENDYDDGDSFPGYGVAAVLNRSVSENSTFRVKLGSDKSEDNFSVDQTSAIGEVAYIHRMQTGRVLASYRRTVDGGGSGVVWARDSLNLNYSRDLSQKLELLTGVSAYGTDALGSDVAGANERDYLQYRLMFAWRFKRSWTVDLDYRYSYLDRKEIDSSGNSNLVTLWLRYNPVF